MSCTCSLSSAPLAAVLLTFSHASDYCLCAGLFGCAACLYVCAWHVNVACSITSLLQKSINSRIWRTFLFVSNQRRLCLLHRYMLLALFSHSFFGCLWQTSRKRKLREVNMIVIISNNFYYYYCYTHHVAGGVT